jgi:hypothetical protein
MIENAISLGGHLIEPLLLIGALFLLGFVATRNLLGRSDWQSFASLSLGVGGGLYTWILFLLSWAGIPLNLNSGLITYGFLLISLTVAMKWSASNTSAETTTFHFQAEEDLVRKWIVRGIWTVIGILIAGAAILSVGLSYYTWDAIANWSIKGYGMALEGSILAGSHWGSVGLSYPLNHSMLIGLFRILNDDPMPGSKLLFPIFYSALILGCYRFLRLRKVRALEASLAVLLLACTPIVFLHATTGYANLSFTFYLCLGVFWVLEGWQDSSKRKSLMGGTLLALSIWTRPEGLLMSAGVVLTLLAIQIIAKKQSVHLIYVIAPQALVASSWLIFARSQSSLEAEAFELSSLALKGVLRGDFRWDAVWVIIRFVAGQVLRFRDWGFTLAAAAVTIFTIIRPKDLKRNRLLATLILLVIVLGMVVFGSHYMAAYSPRGPDWVYEWLSLNFTRLVMPVGILANITAFLALANRLGATQGRDAASSKITSI